MTAAVTVVGGDEVGGGVKDVGDDDIEAGHEWLDYGRYIIDGCFGEAEGGVVIFCAGMLNE